MDELAFGPVNDPSAYYSTPDMGAGLNWSGFGSTLTDLAKVWGGVTVAKTQAEAQQQNIYARAPNGMLYREGIPLSSYQQSNGGSLLPLLLLAGVAFVALR